MVRGAPAKIDEVEEVFEEVAAETPIFKLDDSEQMYVYDPPKNMKKKDIIQSKHVDHIENERKTLVGFCDWYLSIKFL